MKKIRSARISILLTGILVFLGSTLSMSAGTEVITLTKASPEAYPAVTSGAGNWVYTITVTGKVSFLGLNIKNSAPGAADFCSHSALRQPKGSSVVVTDPIPAAAPGACGTDWPDTNGIPLSLVAYIDTADRNARVDIRVDYPDP
jgi:hypothetical protein